MSTREVEFYSCPGELEGALSHVSMNEAIEAYLDDVEDSAANWLDGKPTGLIEVTGWALRQVGDFLDTSLVSHALEALHEEFTHEDQEYTGATEAMRQAEAGFIGAMKDAFTVTTYEPLETWSVSARHWVETHRPEWAEGTP